FNSAASKTIDVVISESGPGFKRLTGAISQDIKDAALAKAKERFESGNLFKSDDMKQMDKLVITDMSHTSSGDPNAHHSVQGETATGVKVKGGHAAEDSSKQTASFFLH
ncbi:hypothetical protein BDY21DRAFT_260342, partial [Lineolata rhizophorae]